MSDRGRGGFPDRIRQHDDLATKFAANLLIHRFGFQQRDTGAEENTVLHTLLKLSHDEESLKARHYPDGETWKRLIELFARIAFFTRYEVKSRDGTTGNFAVEAEDLYIVRKFYPGTMFIMVTIPKGTEDDQNQWTAQCCWDDEIQSNLILVPHIYAKYQEPRMKLLYPDKRIVPTQYKNVGSGLPFFLKPADELHDMDLFMRNEVQISPAQRLERWVKRIQEKKGE